LDQHLIDFMARDDDDLLKQLQGREVTRFSGAKTTLNVAGSEIRPYDKSLRQ
jgi:membrane-bound ClpP family serine protease